MRARTVFSVLSQSRQKRIDIPPIVPERQLRRHAEFRQLVVVEALELVLAVVDAVERRRAHDEQREDDAKDEVVARLGQLVHLLHDRPADVQHRQIHLVHRVRLPYHAAHYTVAKLTDRFARRFQHNQTTYRAFTNFFYKIFTFMHEKTIMLCNPVYG